MISDVPLPLDGLLVLDFSQFLAGPSATLRLADWGARVIKIERPDGGEAGRALYLSNLTFDGDSLLFHTINRNKESLAANLKDPADMARVRDLVARADVLVHSFRPGVIAKLGLDYDHVREMNPRLVYGAVSGYGDAGPWRTKPGQDLLVQAMSGLTWLSGNRDDPPVAFGLSLIDTLAGCHLAQGILALLVRRGVTGRGGLVEVSLMESALDLQFEVLTAHLNDGGALPQRSASGSAHPYLPAPYGIYPTADGFIAIAMNPIPRLAELLDIPELQDCRDPQEWFTRRDEIKATLAAHLRRETTGHWLDILEPADVWCADVLTWPRLRAHGGFKALDMLQQVRRDGASFWTTRCPVRIDGQAVKSEVAAPRLGQHKPLFGDAP
jgi:CoA:oxalate CoA-transferase